MIREYKRDIKDTEAINAMYQGMDTVFLMDALDESIEDEEHVIFVDERAGDIVGIVSYLDKDEGRQVIALYVRPEYRREGIASKLIEAADSGGYMWLYSDLEYKKAHKLYKSLGYKKSRAESKEYFMFTLRDTERKSETKTLILAGILGIVAATFMLLETLINHREQK